MTKSKKPSIQSISRDDFKFLVTWKPGEKSPSKQVLEYAVIKKEKTFNKAKSAAKKDKNAKGVKYHSLSGVDKKDKKANLIIDKEDYYPSSTNLPVIEGVGFRLANKSKKETLSDYDYKVFDTDKPPKPKVEISVDTGQSANRAYISIAVPNDTPHKPVTDVYYQYAIVDDYNGNPQDKKYWEYWNMGDNFKADMIKKSKNIGPIDIDNTGTKTLICHAKTRGMAGDSDEVWAVHQFTEPYKATNLRLYDENSVTIDEGSKITRVKVAWDAPTGAYNNKTAQKYQSNPIDQTTVQYYIGTPEIRNIYTKVLSVTPNAKLDSRQDYYIYESNKYHYVSAPNATDLANDRYYLRSFSYSAPNNAGFTDAQSQVDTKDDDYAVIIVPQIVGLDSCLWIRVVTKRDTYDIPSDPLLVYKGDLTIPTIGTITPNQSTYKATVSVTNNSTVPGSFIALIYRDKTGSEDSGKIIGVIPSGETSVQVQCPNWTGKTPISFGAYAIFGEINYKNVKETPVIGSYSRTADTVIQPNKDYYIIDPNTNTYVKVESPVIDDIGNYYEGVVLSNPMVEYAFDEVMSSEVVYKGGEVPVSPTGIKLLSSVDDASIPDGSIQVTWDVPWLEANGAEISWADHEDAWYSTNTPNTHELELIEEPKLNISGLETGKKWYVRVRLYKESGDNKIYSLYSATYSKDLSMAPDKPVLNISPEGIITRDTEITASWVYISNDGTQQSYGRLEEVIDGEDNIPIGQSSTQQFISFKPSDENVNWESGTSHKLVLYVGSASGQYSEESSSVQIDIAEPIEASIVDTSLIKDKMEINVELYSGTKDSIVQINNPNGIKDVTSLQVALEPVQSGTPSQGSEASDAYLMKASPTTDFNSEYLKIVGGTVAWNQLNRNGDFPNDSWEAGYNAASVTISNGEATFVANGVYSQISSRRYNDIVANHVYLSLITAKSASARKISAGSSVLGYTYSDTMTSSYKTFGSIKKPSTSATERTLVVCSDAVADDSITVKNAQLFDLTQMFGSAIADYLYTLETGSAGAGVAWFKKLFPKPYYAYNAGELMSVKTSAHVTTGFNQWDEEWELGSISSNTGEPYNNSSAIRSKNFCRCIPNTVYHAKTDGSYVAVYQYDADKNYVGYSGANDDNFTTLANAAYFKLAFASGYGTTYKNDICINLSWSGYRNGEYEPYEKHEYPLDSDLELRGIPKLDVSNNLYYDGDEYQSDGSVVRNWGEVDMSTLSWNTYELYDQRIFRTIVADIKSVNREDFFSSVFVKAPAERVYAAMNNKEMRNYHFNNSNIEVHIDGITTVADFVNYLSTNNAKLIYKLATPTTETADTFTSPQTAYPYGTESFTDTRTVQIPVGTTHRYASIYPITGHDEVTVSVRGKNQLDVTASNQTINGVTFTVAEDNSITVNGTATADTYYYVTSNVENYLIAGKQYILNGCPSGGGSSRYGLEILYGRDPIVWARDIGSGYTFTATDSINLRAEIFVTNGTQVDNVVFKPMVRFSTETDATYEPYAENSANYTTSLGTTVYGGTADIVTGGGKVTRGYVDLGTLNWTYNTNYKCFITELSGIKDVDAAQVPNAISSAFVAGTWAAVATDPTKDGMFCFLPPYNQIRFRNTFYTDAATFKTAMSGVQLVYELATPTDLTLTPQSVSLNEGTNNVWSEQGDYVVRTAEWSSDELLLKNLPLDMTVTGGGMNGEAMVTIKRAEDFHTPRPDDPDDYRGYRGDTIFEAGSSQPDENGNYHISISLEDLNNAGVQFDDGAEYQIITTVSDSQNGDGQIAVLDTIPDPDDSEAEHFDRFFVDWTHQAVAPSEFSTEPEVQVDDEYGVAIISTGTPVQSNYEEGDSVDIYRLSADAPMLIYKGAQFNSSYVDPYPTIGKRGGYRLVYVTNNGDYIDNDNIPAWTDYEGSIYSLFSLIDFRNRELEFKFNVDYDWTWTKPFTMTHYLGGGIEGDWTDGTEGSGNIKGNVIDDYEPETYDLIRDLATHNNICHVRTLEGSNFTSNVQVSDSRSYKDPGHLHGVSLSITRVDNPFYDAIPLDLWEEAE